PPRATCPPAARLPRSRSGSAPPRGRPPGAGRRPGRPGPGPAGCRECRGGSSTPLLQPVEVFGHLGRHRALGRLDVPPGRSAGAAEEVVDAQEAPVEATSEGGRDGARGGEIGDRW